MLLIFFAFDASLFATTALVLIFFTSPEARQGPLIADIFKLLNPFFLKIEEILSDNVQILLLTNVKPFVKSKIAMSFE